jgi:hypothetical protein
MLVIENVNESPSASEAVGVNEYASPILIAVAGLPEILGAVFDGSGLGSAKEGSSSLDSLKHPLSSNAASARIVVFLIGLISSVYRMGQLLLVQWRATQSCFAKYLARMRSKKQLNWQLRCPRREPVDR